MMTTKLKKIEKTLFENFQILMMIIQSKKIEEILTLLIYFDHVLFTDIACSVIINENNSV